MDCRGQTVLQVQVGAAVGVLDRVERGVGDLDDDPELGGHEGVAEGPLSVALDLSA